MASVKKTQAMQYELLQKIYGHDAQNVYKKQFPITNNENLIIFENKVESDKDYAHGLVSYLLFFSKL